MRTQTPETLAHPSRDEIELAAVLHALSDPVRLLMVRGLAGALTGGCCSAAWRIVASRPGKRASRSSSRSVLTRLAPSWRWRMTPASRRTRK